MSNSNDFSRTCSNNNNMNTNINPNMNTNMNTNMNMNMNNLNNFNKLNKINAFLMDFFKDYNNLNNPNMNQMNGNNLLNFIVPFNFSNNDEIQFNFNLENSRISQVKAKPYEKLKDVVNRFKLAECPEEYKNSLFDCSFHDIKVDKNKTFKELGVKNEDSILLIEKEKFIYTDNEKKQLNEWKNEFNFLNKKTGRRKFLIKDFEDFCLEKDDSNGIKVKEHPHDLVLLLSNISWKCYNCKKNFRKEDWKYYCSLCDYSMCEHCHYKKKYFLKKSFPKGTKPSNENVQVHFFITPYHQHRLAFCRTSRNFNYFSQWMCDNCREQYDNDQWSFYCTLCDFDLCCECLGYN